jgi:hypothetical protein
MMNDKIAEVISEHTSFSENDVRNAFDHCHSWDTVISAIEIARTFGISNLSYAVDLLSKPFQEYLVR